MNVNLKAAVISVPGHDSIRDGAHVRDLISEVTWRRCVASFGDLKSIVLTGSLARDEASLVRKTEGYELLGDAEFMAIFSNRRAIPPIEAMTKLCDEIERDLRGQQIKGRIDVSAVDLGYLRGLPAHIFSYELKHCGKVIWGDTEILDAIPSTMARELSREDAWRLLCNRLIELLAVLADASTLTGDMTAAVQYAAVKLYLDMATSFLVFIGEYEPSYQARAEKLRLLTAANSQHLAPFSLAEFVSRVSECTEWKVLNNHLRATNGPEFWLEAICVAQALWKWEAAQLTGSSEHEPHDALFDRLSARLTFNQKLRGWASVAKRSGGLRSWHSWPRWTVLSLQTSPRYAVYRVAIELASLLPGILKDPEAERRAARQFINLCRCLPRTSSHVGQLDWRTVANRVIGNYRDFLISTIA